ncbi:MAG: LptF/LptG family permease [Spirochaetia bacterium]|nr:LptF/LptG family permease [Spirochaetia bacterium]
MSFINSATLRSLPASFLRVIGKLKPRILDRYIFLEILVPFLVCLLILTTLFMSIVLKDIVVELLGKGIAIHKVLFYLFNLISEKITQAIPIACLFGGILAAGRLSGDSEIVAMRSAGVSFPRIYVVFLFTGFLTTCLVAFMNLYYGPVSAKARENFENWLKSYHSLTLVKTGRFLGNAKMDGVSLKGQDIYAGQRENEILKEVHIREWVNSVNDQNSERIAVRNMFIPIGDGFITQIVHAETGQLIEREKTPEPVEPAEPEPVSDLPPGIDPSQLPMKPQEVQNEDSNKESLLRLNKGFIIEISEDLSRVQTTNFTNGSMDYVIPPPPRALGQLNVRPENYTFFELFEFIRKLEEGGTEIDPMQIIGPAAGAAKMDKMQPGMTIKLPAMEQMKQLLQQNMTWMMINGNNVGKPGGPTPDQWQNTITLTFQLRFFIENAAVSERKFKLEIQTRIAKAVACMIFFFISFPLGLVVKRSGRGMSFGLALSVCVGYFGLVAVGTNFAESGKVSAAVGGWAPNVAVAFMGMYVMASRTEGFKQRLRKTLRKLRPPIVERQLVRIGNVLGKAAPLFRPVGRVAQAFKSIVQNRISRLFRKSKTT